MQDAHGPAAQGAASTSGNLLSVHEAHIASSPRAFRELACPPCTPFSCSVGTPRPSSGNVYAAPPDLGLEGSVTAMHIWFMRWLQESGGGAACQTWAGLSCLTLERGPGCGPGECSGIQSADAGLLAGARGARPGVNRHWLPQAELPGRVSEF